MISQYSRSHPFLSTLIFLRSGSCSRESEVVGDGYVPARPPSYDNFEVQYRGRLRVSGHKGPDSLIDDCLVKLESKLEKRRSKMLQLQQQQSIEAKKDEGTTASSNQLHPGVEPTKRRRSGVFNEPASVQSQSSIQPTKSISSGVSSEEAPPPKARALSDGGDEDEMGVTSKSSIIDPRAIIFQVGVNDILIRDPTTGSVETKNYEQISKCQTGLQVG